MSRATARKEAEGLDEALERAGHGERVVLRRSRTAVVAAIPMEDFKLDFYSEFPEVAPFQRVRLARKHVGTTNAGSPVGTAEGHAAPSPGS